MQSFKASQLPTPASHGPLDVLASSPQTTRTATVDVQVVVTDSGATGKAQDAAAGVATKICC
jgi:hypothetical protein